jgi:hypothetical protein
MIATLHINFVEIREAQISAKVLFLGVSWRGTVTKIYVWISKLNEDYLSSPKKLGIIESIQGKNRAKERKDDFILSVGTEIAHLLPSNISDPGS